MTEYWIVLFSSQKMNKCKYRIPLFCPNYSNIWFRFTARGKAALLQHARSLQHLRAEQVASSSGEQPGIADIFTVTETSDTEQAESSETGEHCSIRYNTDLQSGPSLWILIPEIQMCWVFSFAWGICRTPRMFRCSDANNTGPMSFLLHRRILKTYKYDNNVQTPDTIHLHTRRFRHPFNTVRFKECIKSWHDYFVSAPVWAIFYLLLHLFLWRYS